MYVCESHSVMSDSLRPHGLCSPWNSPGQNTGVGRLFLLQGSSQPCLLYCVLILNQLSQCLCFHSRPRKGGIYRKEESVCEKEIYLDTGSSFSIHIYGKTEIFYF